MKKTDYKIDICPQAEKVMARLESEGFECYAVGGCVRDALRGQRPEDFDLATNASPVQMQEVFRDFKTFDVGLRHGTLTVVSDRKNIEVTTFRTDGAYSDNRHPDSVRFTRSLAEDLSRRDFTVNAMAWSKKTGLVDPFGGREDLAKGIVRCVGEPDRRFREDALRILRGLRFASVLDFKIEEATVRSMKQETRRLQNISEERIFSELKKLICGEGVLRVLLDFPDIFSEIIPELSPCIGFDQKSRYHCYDVYEHTARTVSYCEPDAAVRLAALFHDIAKPQTFTLDQKGGHFYGHPARSAEMTESILRRLRADTKTIQTVCTLVLYHDRVIPPEKRAVKRMLSKMPLETFLALQKLRYGDRMAHAPEHRGGISELRTIEKLAAEIVKEKECFSIKQLNIKGSDLMQELSMPEGKEVGQLLRMLTDEVIDEKLKNEKSALLKRAGELYAKRCTDA